MTHQIPSNASEAERPRRFTRSSFLTFRQDQRANALPLRLGFISTTVEVRSSLEANLLNELLRRHRHGDWGDLCENDLLANETALVEGGRILSAYKTPTGKVWIITEADASATTILFPHEY